MKRILLLSVVLVFGHAFADQNVARNVLIDKFKRVYLQLPPDSPSRPSVTLRLADLLAERARQEAMQELEKGCVQCMAGEKDRQEAIGYYLEALEKIEDTKKGVILSQLGHLYELTGQREKALALYKKVIAGPNSDKSKAEAQLSLAEIYFKDRSYTVASGYYDQVLRVKDFARRPLAAYRRAWCFFNQGQVEESVEALLTILKTPELLSRSGQGVVSVDEQYKAEVSRDLATFMAKNGAQLDEAKVLFGLSPEKVKISNVAYLAAELERLGQTKEAIEVYRFVIGQESIPSSRLDYLLRTMQLERNRGQNQLALTDFSKALQLWSSIEDGQGSSDKDRKSRMRKFVLDWNRDEKNKVSSEMLSSYDLYLESFPREMDMLLWQSQVLREQKMWQKALSNYDRAIDLTLSNKAEFGQLEVGQRPSLESLLLTQIEIAETVKDQTLLEKIYQKYLGLSVNKTKVMEVKYQLARLQYDSKNYRAAAEAFYKLSFSKESDPENLKNKSADLALDSLVLVKDDALIEKWASEFSLQFPKRKTEFVAIARKSAMNQTATLGRAVANLGQAWVALGRVNLVGATESEQIDYYRNKLVLAEKLNKFSEARQAADQLLLFKSLSKEDRNYALSRKAWLAELVLDFKTALMATSQLNDSDAQSETRSLKLALYSELAGEKPVKYYRKIASISQNSERIFSAAWKIVEESPEPLKEIKKYMSVLIEKPEALAEKIALIAVKNGGKEAMDEKTLSLIRSNKRLKDTIIAKWLWRKDFLSSFDRLDKKTTEHQLNTKSQKLLARSMRARVRYLDQLEKSVQEAIVQQDWLTQALSLKVLGRESERFYNEILSLPMPEGLSDQEQMQYMQMLSQQASPYKVKADQLNQKAGEFWQDISKVSEAYEQQVKRSPMELRGFVKENVARAQALAPPEYKGLFDKALTYEEVALALPSLKEIEGARQAVRMNPLDANHLQALLNLEKQVGSEAMVNYLSQRIEKLEGKEGL